ncbi:MAG: mechanosensitive ion channel family protein [candidate division Zixibacteria bacterium]|nr:mechanosensitive ion channel family protein [candidate division Zixibacteria bacterium]
MLERFGIPLWAEKLIFAGAILIGTLIASYIVRLTMRFIAKRLAKKTKSQLDDVIIDSIKRPVFYMVLLFGFDYEFKYLHKSYEFITDGTYGLLHGIVYTIGVIVATWLGMRLISNLGSWYSKNIASKTETKLDDEFIPIIVRTFKIVVSLMALMAVLQHFNVDIKGLVAVLGVSSLAIALAAKETLANMIAGFILMLDRPFRVGDRVMLGDDRILDVYEIGLRSTKFLTRDNTLVIIPNAEISRMVVDNLSYPAPTIRVRVHVGVAYGSDIDQVKGLLVEAANSHENTIDKEKTWVQFLNFGDSSLDFRVNSYVSDYAVQRRTGHAIRELVYKIFDREGIEIPFPQRVVHMQTGDDKAE